MKAVWNGVVIAESDDIVIMDGDHYFPQSSLNSAYTSFSNHRTSDAKGQAFYQSLFVNGEMKPDAVWHYPEPNESAALLRDRVAFVSGIDIVD